MKVDYELLMYLGQVNTKPTTLDEEKRCDFAYALLHHAYTLIPSVSIHEGVGPIYRAAKEDIESAMESLANE